VGSHLHHDRPALRVGIDVGGTFTDIAIVDTATGESIALKVASTPLEPQRAVLDALAAALAHLRERAARDVAFLAHSTTIATNALLGQVGIALGRVALVTTHGFRDVIEIGRQNRSELYDLSVRRPRPLVARADRFTIGERIGSRGEILQPLDDASLTSLCGELRTVDGIEAVAICLINAYANDVHERRIAEKVAAALPNAIVMRSSAVDPQYREYERFSTTVVNAALAPVVARYVERLERELRAEGITPPLYVMRSDGGLAAAPYAIATPAATIESGPAGGAVAAAALGRRAGIARLLSFDMGGTTAKAGAIVDGVAQVVSEFEAAGKTHSGRALRGSGYPVRFPFVDLAEISAGGGTIARIDDAGSLRVGPLSAGADPGPACYGIGDAATITDANVVLGRLHQTHLLGGTFAIDAARSRAAIAALATPLGLSVEETAAGMVALIDAQMAKALRIVTVERGLDPRDFVLAAFGGGGPLHACALAEDLGIGRIVVPNRPGVFSALGLLAAELHEHAVRPVLRALEQVPFDDLDTWFAGARTRTGETLREQGADAGTLRARHELDARYAGQSFELSVPYARDAAVVAASFHAAHRARYGYAVEDEPIEVVAARLTLSGAPPQFAAPPPLQRRAAQTRQLDRRALWIDGGYREMPVFARDASSENGVCPGPAVIEQYDATTYVAPGWCARAEGDLLALERSGTA
jgi:N-methylhydantoinase A